MEGEEEGQGGEGLLEDLVGVTVVLLGVLAVALFIFLCWSIVWKLLLSNLGLFRELFSNNGSPTPRQRSWHGSISSKKHPLPSVRSASAPSTTGIDKIETVQRRATIHAPNLGGGRGKEKAVDEVPQDDDESFLSTTAEKGETSTASEMEWISTALPNNKEFQEINLRRRKTE